MPGNRMAGRKEFEQIKKNLDERRGKKFTTFWGERTPVLDLTFKDPYISLIFRDEVGLNEKSIPDWADKQYQVTVTNNKRDGREEIFTMNDWDYEAIVSALMEAKIDIEGRLEGVRMVGRKENYTYDIKINPVTPTSKGTVKPKVKEVKDEADEDTTRMIAQKIMRDHPDYSKIQLRLWIEENISREGLKVNSEIRDKIVGEFFKEE